MWPFHYVVLFVTHRRSWLRMLAKEAVAAEDEKAGKSSEKIRYAKYHYEGKRKDVPARIDDVDTCPEEPSFQKPRDNINVFLPSSLKPQSVADRGRSISRERKSSNFERSPPVLCDLAKKDKVLSSEVRAVTGVGDCCSSSTDALKNSKPSSKFIVSTSSEESSSSDRTMDDFVVIGTVTADNLAVSFGRDVRLHAGNETGQFFNREGNELNKVLGELGIRREKRLNSVIEKVQRAHQKRAMTASDSAYADVMKIPACAVDPMQIPPVGTEGVDADVNMAPPPLKKKKESSKDIQASSKGVNLEAVEQKALDLATLNPIRLDTQIRSSISELSVAWKSTAEVLKLAAANRGELVRQHDAEKTALREQFEQEKVLKREQFEKEKALQKDKFEKEVAATKQEVEDEGLSREDVDLAITRKYGEIVFPGDDASPVAEQTLALPVADDPTKEEVVHLRGKVIEIVKALSRARDSINRTQQVHNKLEYEKRLHKSNFDNTFKELFELQCRYGKIKIERDEVLRKETDRFILIQKSLKDKRFVDESDKLECQRPLLSLTLYFEAEVDSERGLKEAYLELLTERGIVSDPARVKFLTQEARNRHSREAQRCSAQAGVSIIWGGVGSLPDELDFCRDKEQLGSFSST
ncbi:hypothetical protein GIB67_026205 [Kingdonia uniflora]|uniref:Uncharacterized protein n=1 Tax=Kingdonia uniflora TaxID=39325 RepID=A0A7J7L9T6_9MAGN|nr:hypothetical protein GIB67_026205 [Kingdonia uniflora]